MKREEKVERNSKITVEDIRAELNKCYRNLRKLRNKTIVKTKRHRYISVLMNWLWFLMQIDLAYSKNLQFLDFSDVAKAKKSKVRICIEKGE